MDESDAANPVVLQQTSHSYDLADRLSKQTWQLRNSGGDYTTYTEQYSYEASDGALAKVTVNNGSMDYAYTYDALRRIASRYNYRYQQTYGYKTLANGNASTLVNSITYAARPGGTSFVGFTLTYGYDGAGNITSVSGGSSFTSQNASYGYDIQGQLTSATTGGKSYTYTYDTYGNIRSVSGGENHTYSYTDTDWLDLLTAYDYQPIAYQGQSYDAATNTVSGTATSGNPISYYNGTRWDMGYNWENKLTSATGSNGFTAQYTYDADGIRSSKTVNGTTYSYHRHDQSGNNHEKPKSRCTATAFDVTQLHRCGESDCGEYASTI